MVLELRILASRETFGQERLEFPPEPSAHPAVEEEVEGGVEDEEDVVEVGHADEVGGHTVATMSGIATEY